MLLKLPEVGLRVSATETHLYVTIITIIRNIN